MQLIVSVLVLVVATVVSGTQGAGQNWAVLVAGSNGWYNYRHQADVCHAYQILHKNGIPDSNIIVMMYDDLAKNPSNPTKGVVINHPDGKDVYKGVPHDYTKKTVTPKNFMNVLLGNKDEMKGVGSGKVLESGPDDNVFIYFTDHGAVGLVAFPTGVLYAKDLNKTIGQMHAKKMYKNMVVYIEACESGSMLEGLLASDINVYATTASNSEESSYACYYDEKRDTYLGDVYSVVWMEDSDAEKIDQETLVKQFQVTKKKTNTSHVMEFGDLKMGAAQFVGDFQGHKGGDKPARSPLADRYNGLLKRDAVPTDEVRLAIVTRKLAAASENSPAKASLEKELSQLLKDRSKITETIHEIARISTSINRARMNIFETVTKKHMKLTQHDCYISVTQHIHDKCFDLQNEFVLNKLWIVANLCEVGLADFTINQAVIQVCPRNGRLHFDY